MALVTKAPNYVVISYDWPEPKMLIVDAEGVVKTFGDSDVLSAPVLESQKHTELFGYFPDYIVEDINLAFSIDLIELRVVHLEKIIPGNFLFCNYYKKRPVKDLAR